MRWEVASDVDGVVFHDKDLRVEFDDPPTQPQQFVFGNDRIDHQKFTPRICTLPLPVGGAAVSLIDDILQDIPVFADHHHTDLDILIMNPIHCQAKDHGENDRVDHDHRGSGEQHVSINDQADQEADSANAEIGFFERDQDAQYIHAAG